MGCCEPSTSQQDLYADIYALTDALAERMAAQVPGMRGPWGRQPSAVAALQREPAGCRVAFSPKGWRTLELQVRGRPTVTKFVGCDRDLL